MILLQQLQHQLTNVIQTQAQHATQRLQLRLHQTGFVILHNRAVGFGYNHFQHIDIGTEKWPLAIHGAKFIHCPRIHGFLQRLIRSQPGWQHQTHLRPGKNPGNGAQRFNTATTFAPRRTTAKCQFTEFLLRCCSPEIPHKIGGIPHHGTIRRYASRSQLFHARTPLRQRRLWR